jgi:hypothetical protein
VTVAVSVTGLPCATGRAWEPGQHSAGRRNLVDADQRHDDHAGPLGESRVKYLFFHTMWPFLP